MIWYAHTDRYGHRGRSDIREYFEARALLESEASCGVRCAAFATRLHTTAVGRIGVWRGGQAALFKGLRTRTVYRAKFSSLSCPARHFPHNFRRTEGTGQSRLIQPQLQLSTTNGETLLFMNCLPPTYKTAIGFPGEPVAPMIGTGAKM